MPTNDGAVGLFLDRLRRFERRRRRVRLLELLMPALTTAACAWTIAVLVARPPGFDALRWGAGAMAAAMLGAVVGHWRERWTRVRIAQDLDRRFGLADRLATAVQCAGDGDAVSSLVVADADGVLSRLDPRDVQPTFGRSQRWLAVSLAAAAMGGFLGIRSEIASGGSLAGGVADAPAAAAGSGAAAGDDAGAPSSPARTAVRQATASDPGVSGGRTAAAANAAALSSGHTAATGRASVAASGTAASAGPGVIQGDRGADASVVAAATVSAGRAGRPDVERPAPRARSGASGVANQDGQGGAGLDGAAGRAVVAGAAAGAGGAAAGAAATRAVAPSPFVGPPRAAADQPRQSAVAPVVEARIPPSRRAVVRAYFAALRGAPGSPLDVAQEKP